MSRLRIASFTHDGPGQPTATITREVERAVDALANAGATIVDTDVPPHLAGAYDITLRYWRRRELSGPEADDLLWDWDRFRRRQLVFASTVDVVVGPVTSDVASPNSPQPSDYVFMLPASLTGAPAATVPTAFDGPLPIAIQLVGRKWEDATVLAAARVVEQAVNDRSVRS